ARWHPPATPGTPADQGAPHPAPAAGGAGPPDAGAGWRPPIADPGAPRIVKQERVRGLAEECRVRRRIDPASRRFLTDLSSDRQRPRALVPVDERAPRGQCVVGQQFTTVASVR